MDDTGNKVFFDGREKAVSKVIQQVRKGGQINIETPFFSSKQIIKDLIKARKKGVDVKVRVGGRSKADQQKLEKAGIGVEVVPGLHAKRIMAADQAGVKEGEEIKRRCVTFFGSDNLTAVSPFHREMFLKSDNPDFYNENMATFGEEQVSKKAIKKIIETSPTKSTVFGSQEYELNDGKTRRVKKLFTTSPDITLETDSKVKRNKMQLNSMTFDCEELVKTFEQGFAWCKKEKKSPPQVTFYLDQSAKKHPDLLKRLKQAGEENVKIYVFNEEGNQKVFDKFRQIQHRKSMIRTIGGEKLIVVSTGNLAAKSDDEINYDSYMPKERVLYSAIKSANNKLQSDCTEYTLPPEREKSEEEPATE